MAWYETWRTSPQADAFLPTDWQRLHMLAVLVEEYWAEPKKELLSEIRLNEAALGGTAADRIRMRWVVAEPEGEAAKQGRAPRSSKPGGAAVEANRRRAGDLGQLLYTAGILWCQSRVCGITDLYRSGARLVVGLRERTSRSGPDPPEPVR